MILNSRTDTFDRKFCGDLASSMASKPVGDHQKTLFGGDIESIFIALTNATDIRDTATIVSLGNDAPAIVARIWQRRSFATPALAHHGPHTAVFDCSPVTASRAGGAGARPDHPISCRRASFSLAPAFRGTENIESSASLRLDVPNALTSSLAVFSHGHLLHAASR
jgi:hypothetical protein